MYVDGPGIRESPDSSKMISPSCYWGLGMYIQRSCKPDPVRGMKAGERKDTWCMCHPQMAVHMRKKTGRTTQDIIVNTVNVFYALGTIVRVMGNAHCIRTRASIACV